MIKQDYLIRMIQEIISLIVNALLKKKKYRWNEWTEYDGLTRQILGFPTDELLSMNTQELIDRYKGDPNQRNDFLNHSYQVILFNHNYLSSL